LVECFERGNLDAKRASALAIGVLASNSRVYEEEEEGELDALGSWAEIDLATLSYVLDTYAPSMTKNERARSKPILSFLKEELSDSCYPTETLQIEGTTIEISGWSEMVQLDALRELLGEGLQFHLAENELLHDIFQIQIAKKKETKISRRARVSTPLLLFLRACAKTRNSKANTPPTIADTRKSEARSAKSSPISKGLSNEAQETM
jgi:hypothetical protein